MRIHFPALCLLAACGGGDIETEPCTDPTYGDGTCNFENTCGVPDIDCFATFATQADAQAWYAANQQPGRPPAPASDPHFARMQGLLERGWEGFKAARPLGDLAKYEPQLVLIDSADPNAFALRDPKQAGLAVMVHIGLLDLDATDAEILGVVMHELEHAVGLHVFDEVRQRIQKFYIAPTGTEPFGSQQADNAMVRAAASPWITAAVAGGGFTDTELSGYPFGGKLGEVFLQAVAAQQGAVQGCAPAAQDVFTLSNFIQDHVDGLTVSLDLTQTNVPTVIPNVLENLRTKCFAGVTADAIAVAAALLKIDPTALRNATPADERAVVEGKDFVLGIFNWVKLLHQKQRTAQAQLATVAWDRVRYFSTEEAADDASVAVLEAMGLPGDSIGVFLPKIEPGLEARCRPLVNSGAPIAYGENLGDAHHATCWRAGHAAAVAKGDAARFTPPTLLPRDQMAPVHPLDERRMAE